MNQSILSFGIKFGIREEYAIEYLEQILEQYASLMGIRPENIAEHIKICGEDRNSYSKTDHDATFMRMKRDYMGNDQLLPGYNVQLGICDEYIAVFDVRQYASDTDCFEPLMEKFHKQYGEYPVADAGYGSLNNYLYCEEHGMKKYMKFTMFQKESSDKTYHDDPYRAVRFPIDETGCPTQGTMLPQHRKPHNTTKQRTYQLSQRSIK